MTRIIVHAGFYKTGTTSLQAYFEENAALFEGSCFYCSKAQLSAAAIAARKFGTRPFWWRRRAFRSAFERAVASLPDANVIVMSREQFSGSMPGFKTVLRRRTISNSSAGIPLSREITRALRRRFGKEASIEFLFTLRDGEAWAKSLFGHIARTTNAEDDYDAFRTEFPAKINLREQANSIGKAAKADRVHLSFLEETAAHPLGPAKALIDLLDLPTETYEKLPPARHENKRFSFQSREIS